MSVAVLLSRLEGVRPSKSGRGRWMARCPAHKDRSASLSVRELDDGRVLIHDFAGCSVDEVLTAAGLGVETLFPDKLPTGQARPEPKPWRASDVARALEHELTIVLVMLAGIEDGKEPNRKRAGECRARIKMFLEEFRRAG